MEIFKQLKELGYKHYIDLTIEELDKLPIDCIERRVECSLVIDWFRQNYGINIHITVYSLVSNTYGFELMSILYQTISTLRTGYNSEHFHGEIIEYKSYEEAQEQAILKCIELLKNK